MLRRGGRVVELCPSQDDPEIVRGIPGHSDRTVELCPSWMILGLSEYPGNPRILRRGEGGGRVVSIPG